MSRSQIMKSGLIFAVATLAVDVKSSSKNEAAFYSGQDGNIHKACSIHTSEKKIMMNCSGVSFQDTLLDSVSQEVNVLDVSYTGLTDVTGLTNRDIFKSLLELNASHNSIKYLNKGIFEKLPFLEKIDLSYNKIEKLPDDVFMWLSELEFLDLSNNKLKSLPNKLPMTQWFDISNNEITSISEAYSSVLYPQTVFLVGQNPFECTCDLLWLKDLIGTRQYLLKFVQHLDAKKFIPECSLPDHLTGKSWNDMKDEEFKCSGLAENDFESPNEKTSSKVQDVKVTVSEIGHTSLVLKWNGNSDESGKVIDIKFHRFGDNKEPKQVILPFSATSYRLRNLEPESPYVVCFTLLFGPHVYSLGCEEIFTTKDPNNISFTYLWDYLIQLVNVYSNCLLALLILLMTTMYIKQRWEKNKDETYVKCSFLKWASRAYFQKWQTFIIALLAV